MSEPKTPHTANLDNDAKRNNLEVLINHIYSSPYDLLPQFGCIDDCQISYCSATYFDLRLYPGMYVTGTTFESSN